MGNNFNEDDKKKVIEFLNLIGEKATFDTLKLTDIIKIYGSLSFMQQVLIPKIDANTLEVVAVHESEPSESTESSESSEE